MRRMICLSAFDRSGAVQVKSVHELEPFVLILDGQPDERRHVVNAGALLPAVKDAFPGARSLRHFSRMHAASNPIRSES